MIEPVRKQITVNCSPDTAFDTFTRRIADWWPGEAHSVSAMNGETAQKIVLEPHKDGRVYEISHEGKEIEWGRVTVFDEGNRLVLDWHINRPASEATEVEVTFSARNDGKTDVVLIHRNFEAMGDDGSSMRDGYDKGWVNVFERCFADACR